MLALGEKALLLHGLRGHLYRCEDIADPLWLDLPIHQPALIATSVRLRGGVVVLAGQARFFSVSRDGGRSFSVWDPGLSTAVARLLQAPDGTLLAFGEAGVSLLPSP
jgi:hypothetical protein